MAQTMNSNGIGDSIKNKQYGAKSSTSAVEVMQQMLQERCIAEPMFAIKMANPNKSVVLPKFRTSCRRTKKVLTSPING